MVYTKHDQNLDTAVAECLGATTPAGLAAIRRLARHVGPHAAATAAAKATPETAQIAEAEARRLVAALAPDFAEARTRRRAAEKPRAVANFTAQRQAREAAEIAAGTRAPNTAPDGRVLRLGERKALTDPQPAREYDAAGNRIVPKLSEQFRRRTA